MSLPPLPTNLSKDGIQKLITNLNDTLKQGVYLQVLEFQIKQGQNGKQDCVKAVISDGFCKFTKAFFAQKAMEEIKKCLGSSESEPNKLPIILVQKAIVSEKKGQNDKYDKNLIVTQFEIIIEDCPMIIGGPIDYQIYKEAGFINGNGGTDIPANLHNRKGGQILNQMGNLGKIPQQQMQQLPVQQQNQQIQQQQLNKPINQLQQQQQFQQKPNVNQQQIQQVPIMNQQNINRNPLQPQSNSFNNNNMQFQNQMNNNNNNNNKMQNNNNFNNFNNNNNKQQQQVQAYQNNNNQINQFNQNRGNQQQQQQQLQKPQQQYQQQQQQQQQFPNQINNKAINNHSRKGPIQQVNNDDQDGGGEYQLIRELYTGIPIQWVLKARLTNKSDIRTFTKKNGSGDGKLFSIDLMDKENNSIAATFFGEEVDTWYEKLHVGKVYSFSQAKIGPNNYKKGRNMNEYQITIERVTVITSLDNDSTIAIDSFKFIKIAQLSDIPKDTTVDLVGIIKQLGEQTEIRLKNGETKSKQSIFLFDETQTEAELTLWGDWQTKFNIQNVQVGQILTLREARVGEFKNQKNLSISFNTQITLDNYQVAEVQELRAWFDTNQDDIQNLQIKTLSTEGIQGPLKTISELETEIQGNDNNIQFKKYSEIRAYIGFHRITGERPFSYQACPKCLKKVLNQGDDVYACEKCQQNVQPQNRYITSVCIKDATGEIWVNLFENEALKIFPCNADTAKQLIESGQEHQLKTTFNECLYKEYVFKIQTKVEEYNMALKFKHEVKGVSIPNNVNECQQLISKIQQYQF